MEGEKVSFRKFFGGIFDGKTHLKVAAFVIILLVWFAVGYSVKSLFNHFRKPEQPQVINSSGGAVDTSTHKSWWSLFDINFGGQNK